MFKIFKSLKAAFCWAFFLEEPIPNIFFEFGIWTSVLNIGLCCGPVFLKKIYFGNSLNFFKLNSCNLVFESINVIVDFKRYSFQKLKINFSAHFKPLARYMAPTIASKQSLLILSANLSSFLCDEPKYINFFKLIFF